MTSINKLYLIGAGIMITIGLISGEVHKIAIDQLQYNILVGRVPIESYSIIRYTSDWLFFIGYIIQALSTGILLIKSKLIHILWAKYMEDV